MGHEGSIDVVGVRGRAPETPEGAERVDWRVILARGALDRGSSTDATVPLMEPPSGLPSPSPADGAIAAGSCSSVAAMEAATRRSAQRMTMAVAMPPLAARRTR